MDLNALQMQTRSLDISSNRNEAITDALLPVLQQFASVSAIVWITTNLKEGAYSCSTLCDVMLYPQFQKERDQFAAQGYAFNRGHWTKDEPIF